MGIFGWIVIACILWWAAHQYDKKINENFMNFLIRFENIEQRVHDLEIDIESKEQAIKDLEGKNRDLNERLFKFENHL